MSTLIFLSNIISAGASFLAAVYWWRASMTDIPPFPDVGLDSYSSVFEPVRQALQESSRLNAAAARYAGVAAAAMAISVALQMFT